MQAQLVLAVLRHLAYLHVGIDATSFYIGITALLKDNGRVRGISAGDTFRRLVSKALARQFQNEFLSAVAYWP